MGGMILLSAIDGWRWVFRSGTEDLESRLESHNQGNNPHTSRHRPWRIKTAIAFTDKQKALDFEEYPKSSSGRAFAKKRL